MTEYLHASNYPGKDLLSTDYFENTDDEMEFRASAYKYRTAYIGAEDREIEKMLLFDSIRDITEDLNPREKELLEYYLWELDGLWITNAELAEKYHVTPMQISLDYKKIIKKLKKIFADDSAE